MLDTFPDNPCPEDVHTLRTHTRRLEATISALVLARDKEPRRVLKLITPVRKAAGKVRDMDVLIENALTLKEKQNGAALVRLVEFLAGMRARNAKKLHDAVNKRHGETLICLKELSKLLKKRLKDASGTLNGDAAPQIVITELTNWPSLNAENLHMFRHIFAACDTGSELAVDAVMIAASTPRPREKSMALFTTSSLVDASTVSAPNRRAISRR